MYIVITLTKNGYIKRITSDTFRWLINSQGMGVLKSKFMSNVLDCYQKHIEKKKWRIDCES